MRGNSEDVDQRRTRVGCADPAGRPHDFLVVDDPAGLVLVFPPDAWAVFDLAQVQQLRALLVPPVAGSRP